MYITANRATRRAVLELQPQVHVVLDVLYSSNSRSFPLALVFITKQLVYRDRGENL